MHIRNLPRLLAAIHRELMLVCFNTYRSSLSGIVRIFAGCLRTDTVVETKPAIKLVKTNGQCIKVHKKFLIVIVLLVITTSTDTVMHEATLKLKLGKLVTTVSPLKTCRVYLRDRSAQTTVQTAALVWKLSMELVISSRLSILTPSQPILALTL